MEARERSNPGGTDPHSAEPVLGLAEGETRGLHAGYDAPYAVFFNGTARRPGSHSAAIAPANDSAAATALAAANPPLKSSASARLPNRANAATDRKSAVSGKR